MTVKWLISGVGNPGEEYKNTRHNVGFYFADEFAKKVNITFKEEKKIFAEFAKTSNILIAKPLTFMNESGKAIRAILSYFHLNSKHLIVIHDDNDLPFGTVRLRTNGSSAGHRGIESIISHLKTENFIRLRVGIRGQQKKATPHFVLGKFTTQEKTILKKLRPLVFSSINEIIDTNHCHHQDIKV